MKVWYRQEILSHALQPLGPSDAATTGTVPVAARIVGRLHRAAPVTLPGVAPHARGAAGGQLGQHATLSERRFHTTPRQILARIGAQQLGYREPHSSGAGGLGDRGSVL